VQSSFCAFLQKGSYAGMAIVVWIGPHQYRLHSMLVDHAAHFGDRGADLLEWDRSDAVEAVGIGMAEIPIQSL
jgi:hypothetical protein